jgi:hypothetical protein
MAFLDRGWCCIMDRYSKIINVVAPTVIKYNCDLNTVLTCISWLTKALVL